MLKIKNSNIDIIANINKTGIEIYYLVSVVNFSLIYSFLAN